MTCPLIRLVSAFLLSCAACRTAATDTVVRDTLLGGFVRVMNTGPSEWADTSGWKLVLDHAVQPAEGSPGELGNPRSFGVHPDGSLVVSEPSPVQVSLYDSLGQFVRAIGREGSGPGEYRSPEQGWVGDTVVVHDNSARNVFLFLRDGTFLRDVPSACCAYGSGIGAADSGFRVTGYGRDGAYWLWLDTDGRRLDQPAQIATP